jgi:hypothetical protein
LDQLLERSTLCGCERRHGWRVCSTRLQVRSGGCNIAGEDEHSSQIAALACMRDLGALRIAVALALLV